MIISTSILHHFRPLEQDYSFIKYILHGKIGQNMGNMDGILDHHFNMIVV